MKKIILVASILGYTAVCFAQRARKPDLMKINLSAFADKENSNFNEKKKIQFAGTAIVIEKNIFTVLEYDAGDMGLTLGYAKKINKEITLGLGFMSGFNQNITKTDKDVLLGLGMLFSYRNKDLEAELISHYGRTITNKVDNWSQNKLGIEAEITRSFGKRYKVGFWARYTKNSNKEPGQFVDPYTILYENFYKFSNVTYTEDRLNFRLIGSYAIHDNILISAGPQINQNQNLLHDGMSRRLANTREKWDLTTFFVRLSYKL